MVPAVVSALQNLSSCLLLVEVDLESALFLFDLQILHLDQVLQFFLTIFESIQLGLLDFSALFKLPILTLNRAFENVKFLLHGIVLAPELVILRFLSHCLGIFEVNPVFFLGSHNNFGLLPH